MLSYVHGSGLTPLLGQTIGASLNRAAAQFGHRDALISCHQKLTYTYSELLQAVNRAARALLHLGVERGDRVGIWSPNAAEWMISQFAAAKVGAILVNVNPSYQLRELEFALTQSGMTVLIAARRFRKCDYVDMLSSLMPRIPSLRHLVYLGTGASAGATTWSDFIELGDRVDDAALAARERELQFDDPINIQYTSGTTGAPKGATLSHHNILNNGFLVGEVLKYSKPIGSAFRCRFT
jgi:fatty-acyl-CoA synthase